MTKQLTYVFDLDGTLFTIKPLIAALNNYTRKHLKIREITQYDLFEVYDLDYHNSKDVQFFNAMLPNAFATQQINTALLRDIKRWHERGIKIVILTARDLKYYDVTRRRLKQFNVPYDALIMQQHDKTQALLKLAGDRFFDDRGAIMTSLLSHPVISKQYELTLIDAPYNQDVLCSSRYYFPKKHLSQ